MIRKSTSCEYLVNFAPSLIARLSARLLQSPFPGLKRTQSRQSIVEYPLEGRNIEATFSNDLIAYLSRFLTAKGRMNLLSVNKNWNALVKRPLTLILPCSDNATLSDRIKFVVEAKLAINYDSVTFAHIEEVVDIYFTQITLLSLAVKNNQTNLVNILKERGVEIDNQCYSFFFSHVPILHRAILHNNITILAILLSMGANIESTDESGRTPLHWAITFGHELMVEMLLTKKANIQARDVNGLTPRDYALRNGNRRPDLLTLLEGEQI